MSILDRQGTSTTTAAVRPGALRCTCAVDRGRLELRIRGEIDVANVHLLDAWLGAAQAVGNPVVLDLGAVPFLDSSALKALLQAAGRSAVRIRSATPAVRRVLRVSGVDQVITVDPSPPG